MPRAVRLGWLRGANLWRSPSSRHCARAPDGSHVEIRLGGEQVQVTVTTPGRRLLGPISLPSTESVAVALVEDPAAS